MNKPKTLDNTTTQAFTADFLTARELCESCRTADDIFSGVLAAKTWGNSAARSLSRQTLFHILQSCPTITVDGIDKATAGRYATSTLQAYAAAARVASWALAGLAGRAGQKDHRPTIQEERRLIDAPFRQQLQALGLV